MSALAPRPASSPKPVLDSLMDEPKLARVIQRVQWIDALEQRLRPHLPPALAGHARLANVEGGRLVYLVDSPVWHTRLRLSADAVLSAARALGVDVSALSIRIAAAQAWRPDVRQTASDPRQKRFGTSTVEGCTLRALRELLRES